MSLLAVVLAMYGIFFPLVSTYDEKHDKFGSLHIPSELGIAYLVVPCVVLAVFFHPLVTYFMPSASVLFCNYFCFE